jgi:hypothetical protein
VCEWGALKWVKRVPYRWTHWIDIDQFLIFSRFLAS